MAGSAGDAKYETVNVRFDELLPYARGGLDSS